MKLYNYGCPRTGNQAFTDYVFSFFPDGTLFRVVHMKDPVPHLPMTEMGFNHAGNEAFYNDIHDIQAYEICKSEAGQPENPNCADIYYSYDPNDHQFYLGIDISGQCHNSEQLQSFL
jgi:hypothetical protein